MIIPGNAVLSMFSPPPEVQGSREEGNGFGQLLTKIEHQATPLPDQEDGERRALESVLQVLLTMFQSFTPANPAQAVAAPRAGESGVVSVGPASATAVLQESMQDLRELFMTPPTTSLPLEARGASTTGALSDLPISSTPTAALGTPSGVTSLDTAPYFSGDSVLATPETPFVQLITPLSGAERRADIGAPADRVLSQAAAASPEFTQTSLTSAGEGDRLTPETAPQAQQNPIPPAERSNPLSASALAYSRATVIQRPQQPGGSSTPDLELRSPVGPTQPEGAPAASLEGVSPGPIESPARMTSHTSLRFGRPEVHPPLAATAAAPGAVQTAAPYVEEAPVSSPAVPQADAVAQVGADSHGLRTMSGAEEEAALPERDHSPSPRRATESEERASESTPSMPHLAADGALPSPLTGATSHTSSAGSDTSVPPSSHPFEDVMGPRQWPRPLPSNTILLHLEPRELGALLVQVRVSEKRLIASFRAQSPEAEALLRTHLSALHESLSQQGFEVQPIVITQAAEGFSTHLGAGTGAFTQQHSAFQAFAQDQQAAGAGDTQSEVDVNRTPRWLAEQRPRLLDVVI